MITVNCTEVRDHTGYWKRESAHTSVSTAVSCFVYFCPVHSPVTKVPDIEAQATKASDIEAITIESQAKSDSDFDDSDFVFITPEGEGR